jgi:hypothetical protein
LKVYLCGMKKTWALYFILFLLATIPVYAQKKRKLTKEESAKLTQDQRVVYESDRKSKNGKKKLTMKQKVKIDRKQARKSRKIKPPKRRG